MANLEAGMSSDGAAGGEYQVFLSFRGPDTRHGFTDCLYHALVGAGIRVFRDDDELRVGEVIGGELLRAIDNSILYIPIFSRSYATSKWCLRELTRIVENTDASNRSEGIKKKILPIFFDVEPEDVKLKTSLYRDALLEHEKKVPEEVEAWRKALVQVDEIKGWNLNKDEGQGHLIKLVVEEVLDNLKIKHKPVTEHLVGLPDRVVDVMKLLDINSGDVRLIGIHGMGGIGKTTLAKVIFNQLSSHFGKRRSFLEDIREESRKDSLVKLQEKLLSEIINSKVIERIPDADYGMRRTGEILCNKMVLIVLDDVDKGEQIEKLLGKYSLYPGTRIIVTTRNTGVLQIKGFKYTVLPYQMEELNFNHALQLFERHAFGGDSPSHDHRILAREIVSTTGGLPLALEVIGSLLYRKPRAIWSETLEKSREIPENEVQRKLKISYDALDDYQQQIFLDIACFFINEDTTNAIYMWTECQFFPEGGIDVLISMSLIKILDNRRFWMHDQLRDLGREIVHKESLTDPGERSRLWISEEIHEILRTKESKKKVQAFDLDGKYTPILITDKQLERFRGLRFLKLCDVTFIGDFSDCLSKIRWFCWHSPPQSFWAVNMHSRNIVVLELSDNHFTDDSNVWSLMKMATKLKVLTLKKCFGITRTPDISKCLMLERLTLERCDNLTEIDCSIGRLRCLIDLNINGCSRLEELPKEAGGLENLKRFSLTDCYRVSKLPDSIGKLASLMELFLSNMRVTSLPDSICRLKYLSSLYVSRMPITKLPDSIAALVKLKSLSLISTEIRELPISIGKLKSLHVLDFSCKMIPILTGKRWKLPNAIGMLENLEEIHAERCEELEGKIPDEVGNLLLLRILNLSDTRIDAMPSTISMLPRLQELDLSRCHEIKELPKLPTSLICLRVESRSLLLVPNLSNLTNLEELLLSDGSRYMNGSDLMQTSDLSWIGRLSKLNKLELRLWNNPTPPTELSSLILLEELTLSSLDLQPLEQLPSSLLELRLDNFNSTRSLSSNLRSLSILKLCGSRVKEIQLHGLLQLRNLTVECCELLERLSILSSLKNLIYIRVCKCSQLVDIQFHGVMESLQYLSIEDCESVERLHAEVSNDLESTSELAFCGERVSILSTALKKLKECSLVSCGKLLEIQFVGMLESLEYFLLYHCHAITRLGGLANIKNLRHLAIGMCSQLRVVEGLDKLEILDELNIFGCYSLERPIDAWTTKIPDECRIYFTNCGELLVSDPVGDNNVPFERYKEMILRGTADTQSETKNSELETEKEAKMKGDAKEHETELQLQFQPSTSSRDHEIIEEPPVDHVRERTSPGEQNQTTEQDSNPISLNELAPPRTFSDRFKTCLVSILECICNRDFPRFKGEIL
ncbi:hypothetical protein ACJRO7_015334 [Eucalyptus globulus]|uniref:TIR domain-containing protein n=1 Tax=Eucalyptus globulus TaxID=34317 RepID=A0ABD3L465_EUCGL